MSKVIDFINAYLDVLTEEFYSRDGIESLLFSVNNLYIKDKRCGLLFQFLTLS